MNSIYGSIDLKPSYLSDKRFIEIIESVYKVQSTHIVGDDYGIPVFLKKNVIGADKIISMPFNFYPPLIGKIDAQSALQCLMNIACKQHPPTRIEFKSFETIDRAFLEKEGVKIFVYSIVSDLIIHEDYEAVKRGYKTRHRTSVNAAKKRNADRITLQWANLEELPEWFTVLQNLYKRKHHMITQPLVLFEKLLKCGLGRLLLAKDDHKIIGGIFLLTDPQRWDYCWGAIRQGYESKAISIFLLDHAIEAASVEGIQVFGFGSSSCSDEKLRFFKSRWGCIEKEIYSYCWGGGTTPIDLNNSYTFARSFLKYIPNSLLGKLSAVAVKYLI